MAGGAPALQFKTSLDRDAFGEIARFVDVAAEGNGEMVSEKLQRNDGQNGLT
jgi:hypothetical protein